MLNWFRKSEKPKGIQTPITTDVHSHLLSAIDDGVQRLEDAVSIIRRFQSMGYTKLITTPHVMSDAYRNTPEIIHGKLNELREHLHREQIDMKIEAAAEYYLDEYTFRMVSEGLPTLTFGGEKKYLLFETNFLIEPFNLREFIFVAMSKGYQPVLAHPERYLYLQNDWKKMQDIYDRGVLFQVNITSITGYYSKGVQLTANKLIDQGWIHFLGSDCHHDQHAQLVESASKMKYYQKALSLPLLNNSL